jgi:hypothetical protein
VREAWNETARGARAKVRMVGTARAGVAGVR